MNELLDSAKLAKAASLKLAVLTIDEKNKVLLDVASAIDEKRKVILLENKKDLENANDLEDSLLKRLKLDDNKIDTIIQGLKNLVQLDDPIGKTIEALELDEGLELYKVVCPLGVVGAIFESRPDALVQIFSLCFKSGNACFLKGGSEAKNTNEVLYQIIKEVAFKVVENSVILLKSREEVSEILKLDEYIDLLIPRGSNKFVKFIQDNSKIPVLGHADGICHAYIDSNSDLDLALKVVIDAKTQYPAVCNAIETLLVHKDVAEEFLNKVCHELVNLNVELRGDEKSCSYYGMKKATDLDWSTEYNDLILSIKIVDSIDEAINHINKYGSKHSELIVCRGEAVARKFMNEVDASSVMWNCSTRFADGFRYGKGAETGISTGKIHARGPVGLEGLTIYKYLLRGEGHIVKDYEEGDFTHKRLEREW